MSKKSKSAKITRISAQSRTNPGSSPKSKPEITEAEIVNPTGQLNDKVVTDPDDLAEAKKIPDDPTESKKGQNDDTETQKIQNDNAKDAKTTDTKSVQKSADAKTTKDGKISKADKAGDKSEKPLKEVFILARPFVALGRYLRDSWRELRQVRWPNRKATWKMTLAVLAYCAVFILLVTLLDIFFTFIFKLILGQ